MSNFDIEMNQLKSNAEARQLRSDVYYLLKKDYLSVKDLSDDDLDYIVDCGQTGRVAIKTVSIDSENDDNAVLNDLIQKSISKQRKLRVSRLVIITNQAESICTGRYDYVIMSIEYIKKFHIHFKQYPNLGFLDQAFYPDNFKRMDQTHETLLNYSNKVDRTPINYDKEYLYSNAQGFERFSEYAMKRDKYEQEIVAIVDQLQSDNNFNKIFYTLLREQFTYEMYVPYYEESSKINLFQSHVNLSILFFNAEYIYVDDKVLEDLSFVKKLCDENLSQQKFKRQILNYFGNPLIITKEMVIRKIVQVVLGLAFIILMLQLLNNLNF